MNDISEIKSKLSIEDLIGKYVELKRTGKNYKGRCPFHNEKTPSFIVSPDIQRYRCFGCGKSGDIFNFVMDYEGMEFGEALKFLADKTGVKLTQNNPTINDKKKDLAKKIIQINSLATKFYNFLLTKHNAGKSAKEYLKNRGITDATISEFRLGYAPNAWEELSNFLKKRKYNDADLIESGISKPRKTGTTYDLFRNRITFPFIDHLDRVVGFSARALEKDQNPKYINTPETEIFHKEKFLFGLNFAKKNIKEDGQVIIVEGMMDMISLYQNGFKNVVASGGTALTPGQINLLKRYTDTILLIFDNDTAGQEAMLRGIHVVKDADLNIKIGVLPDGIKDPDELMKENPKKFEDVKKNAIPLWDFYIKFALSKFKIENIFDRKKAYNFLVQSYKQIPDNVTRAEYVHKLCNLFEMNEDQVIKDIETSGDLKASSNQMPNSASQVKTEDYKMRFSEIYLLSLLFKLGKTPLEVYLNELEPEYFKDIKAQKIFALLKVESQANSYEIKGFYDKLVSSDPDTNNLFEQIYLLDNADISENSSVLSKEISTAIRRLKREFYIRELKKVSTALKKAEISQNQSEVDELISKADQYREALNR